MPPDAAPLGGDETVPERVKGTRSLHIMKLGVAKNDKEQIKEAA